MTLPAYSPFRDIGLWSHDDSAIPLVGIEVHSDITYPVAITRLQQRFRNTDPDPIEARYVFPAPLEAILTGMEIVIGERRLTGVVQPKARAERTYEAAIVKGDGAFLLSQLDDGLYQISVGNVAPGEEILVEVQWVEFLRWSGNEIRYRLPNLVGPHYGDPQRAGIAPADAPIHSTTARYAFDISVCLRGELAKARAASPSHLLSTQHTEEGTRLSLQQSDTLNRALTLTLTLETPPSLVAWSAPDGDNTAVLASLLLPPSTTAQAPRHLTLVVDCSGSMQGVSIAQARRAALQIVDALGGDDSLSLVRYGSTTDLLTLAPAKVGPNRELLRESCARLEADMGGTEMQAALATALTVCPEGGDILLITDGQVHFSDTDIRRFAQAGRRLFTIGVGPSTSEKVLKQLSAASGGFCELVSPNEDMAEHIVRHFRRLYATRLSAEVEWPATTIREHIPGVLFAGDTALFTATLAPQATSGELQVRVRGQEEPLHLKGTLHEAEGTLRTLLPRLVAWYQLPRDHVKRATEDAVKYQLVTAYTSLVAVLARHRSPDDIVLPVVVDVPQMRPDAAVMYSRAAVGVTDALACDYHSLERPMLRRVTEASDDAPEAVTTLHQSALSRLFGKRRSLSKAVTPRQWLEAVAKQTDSVFSPETLAHVELPAAVRERLEAEFGVAGGDGEKWERVLLALAIMLIDRLPTAALRKMRELHRALASMQQTVPLLEDELQRLHTVLPALDESDWGF